MKKRMSKRRIKKLIEKTRKSVENSVKSLIADGTIHPARPFSDTVSDLREKGYSIELDPATTYEDRANRICRVRVIVPTQKEKFTWRFNNEKTDK